MARRVGLAVPRRGPAAGSAMGTKIGSAVFIFRRACSIDKIAATLWSDRGLVETAAAGAVLVYEQPARWWPT